MKNYSKNRHGTRKLGLLLGAMAILLTAPSWASCSVSASGLSFGAYQPLTFPGHVTSVDVLSTGSISVTCSNTTLPTSYTLALGPSNTGAGDRISTRYLANGNGGDDMAYNLYTDAARNVVWGDGNIGTRLSGTVPAAPVSSQTQNATFYGKVPGGQRTLKPGTYSGLLTITLSYIP